MKMRSGLSITKLYIAVFIGAAVVVGIFAVAKLDTTGRRGSGLGPEYDYDISQAAKIDPNLIIYRETGTPVSTGFSKSEAIFVDSTGLVYIAGDKAIRVFSQNGSVVKTIDLAGEPGCLTVAEDGKIYVGTMDHIEVYDGQGKLLSAWKDLGEGAVLTSVAISKNDAFVADAGNRVVLHYDVNGTLINRIGQRDDAKDIAGFVVPSPYFDLAVGPDGLLRVVNPGFHRIEAYTFSGDLEFSWGEFSTGVEGFCGCCNPVNFAILADGSFVTCEKGIVRVKVYNSDGAFVGVVAGPNQLIGDRPAKICETVAECQVGGFDVAVDGEGKVYILDTIKNVIRTFARNKAG
jgi:hypothetical protein